MSVLKCKMCGGTLSVDTNSGIAVCDYCGTKQTVSKTNDDVVSNLYNRANNLRLKNEFDKAQSIYEKIIEENDSEAEAHWGIVLCKYGIEYVDDPVTSKKIPTCHRTSFESIKSDIDYQAAIDYADSSQQVLYEEEAREIDRLQRDILNIARNEKPFDVFICYKETDENGKRTMDSVIANEIYYQLVQEGFKVFYAAITLEDKLGQEYEPYIFAALNSAKVMLVIGTKPEYFNAVWVKNEWSRYLSLMKKDRSKLLIPCYRDMDAYDLPDEFAHLQAQDMSKIGFINDVIRGIKKIILKEEKVKEKDAVPSKQEASYSNVNIDSLMKRAFIFLEDSDYKSADEYFDRVLDNDPENGEAYLGKLLVEKQLPSIDKLVEYYKNLYSENNYEEKKAFEENADHINSAIEKYVINNYLNKEDIKQRYTFDCSYHSSIQNRIKQKEQIENELNNNRLLSRAFNYASSQTKDKLNEIINAYNKRIEEAINDDENTVKELTEKYEQFLSDTDKKVKEEYEEALNKKDNDYQLCIKEFDDISSVRDAVILINKLRTFDGYKESKNYIELCNKKIDEIKSIDKKNKKAAARKRNKKIIIVSIIVVLGFLAYRYLIGPMIKYNKALSLYENGDHASAYILFNELGDYKDSIAYKDATYSGYCKSLFSSSLSVGDTVLFGTYEQDDNGLNGKESIEWIVLDKQSDSLLVISKYALDNQQYNETKTDVVWSGCSLRWWLNSDFYNNAFSETEKQFILCFAVSADSNPSYPTNQGVDTSDYVFLLSINEANKYFNSDSERQCQATEYAYSLGAYKNEYVGGYCSWWLRTSGFDSTLATDVGSDGIVHSYGYQNYLTDRAVRPAMWIGIGD